MYNYDIIIATFLRYKKLRICLDSISKLYIKPAKVVVADQGNPPEVNRIYREFSDKLNLDVIKLEFDAGLSKARNAAYSRTSSEYILMIDDDHYVPSNVFELIDVLEENPDVGGVSPYWLEYGYIVCHAGDIKLGKDVTVGIYRKRRAIRFSRGIYYYLFDFIPNSTMFRRECLDDYRWDENFKIGGEHADFYITHKKMGRWRFAVTPNYVIIHDPLSDDNLYRNYRMRKEEIAKNMRYLVEKHGIRSFIVEEYFITRPRPWWKRVAHRFMYKFFPKYLIWWYLYYR